jgi:hypothetical protein
MSIISSPISKEDFNKLYTQRIQNYNQSLKLNAVTYFAASVGANSYLEALASGQIKMPKTLGESETSDILTYIDKGRVPSLQAIQKIINEYPHVEVDYTNQYIFLGDIAHFSSTFFPGMLPSITKVIIEHLVFNKVVNIFGSATKRFLLLKNWDISDTGITTIQNKIKAFDEQTYSNFSDVLKQYVTIADESMRNYQVDQAYLLDVIDRLSKRVVELETALETQQREGVNGYLLSWH